MCHFERSATCQIHSPRGLPSAGELGRNACGRVVANFDDRMPHKISAGRMGRDGLPVSTGTVHNVLARMGRNLGVPAEEVVAIL